INANGELEVSGLPFITGDEFKIAYNAYYPVVLPHSLNSAGSQIEYIKVVNKTGGEYEFILDTDYTLSEDGYAIYFFDLNNSILKSGYYTIYDRFEIKYTAPLTRKVDLSTNILLMLQDSFGNNVPIDTIPIDSLGFFEYEQALRVDSPLSIPLGGSKRIVNMLLSYLPLNVYDKSADNFVDILYNDNDVGKIYPYIESNSWAKPITIITKPEKMKLIMVENPTENIVINQQHFEEREYQFNYNPMEMLGVGEEYTKVMIDALVQQDYSFTFKLTNTEDKPVNNSVIWLQIGLTPKAKTRYVNERMILDNLDISPYFESLGTEEITSRGPGEYPEKLFGRPLTYETKYVNTEYNAYGPYYWMFSVTDEFGLANFDISFNHDYLEDFTNIFGSMEGFYSIEDVSLYLRAFSSNFEWDKMVIDSPDEYLCSKNGTVFNGSTTPENPNFSNSILKDATYVEGLVRLHKKDLALGSNDYYSYKLPGGENEPLYEPLILNLFVTEATPIPSTTMTSIESLTKIYTSSELEPLSVNVLEGDYAYYANIDLISPSGHTIQSVHKEIHDSYASGFLIIDNETMYDIVDKLGPGISTIKVQVAESESYKPSPILIIPLEIVPENYIKFGEKNSEIDLIEPFISAWGSAYNDETEMPFESNYPHLIGSVWVEPEFNEIGAEVSVQDYIGINLDATIYNDDGTTSTFPLRDNIMLRPGNRDGIMTFSSPLGPEGAFLMGLQVDLKLSFNIDFNKDEIFDKQRDIKIYLLDLRLETNPSSNKPNTIWSIYDDGFTSSEIIINTNSDTTNLESQVLDLDLGGEEGGEFYGQEVAFLFDTDTLEYSIDSNSELLSLVDLSEIVALKVVGIKEGDEYEFTQGTDWTSPYSPSGDLHDDSIILFSGINLPDDGSEFSVIYKLKFRYETGTNYVIFTLGYTNDYNETSIELQLPQTLLPESDNSYSPMFTRFTDRFTSTADQTEFVLNYGLNGITIWDDYFIIYNEEELELFGEFTTGFSQGRPTLFFNPPGIPEFTEVEVIYGVKSQYELSYGFQKIDKFYSDSVRLIHNNDASQEIIDEINTDLSAHILGEPSLYISLDDSEEETILKLINLPLLYAPEINLNFTFDKVLLDIIESFGSDFNDLTIEFKYITNDGFYEFYSDPKIVPLDYVDGISPLILNDIFSIEYNKDLQAIYDMVGTDSVDVEISLSQVGESENYIPYIILEEYNYTSDTHIVESYDQMPLKKDGTFDIKTALNQPHYWQIFSRPFIGGYYGETPFDLMVDGEVTVALKDLPNSTLISLDTDGEDYAFDYWGSSKTLPINAENFYMIPNLAMFIDTYNIEETVYQDGYLDLYSGSGTEINGEQQYITNIFMDYASGSVPDYTSSILNNEPTSWEKNYDFANQFLTTDTITVSGRVFYHQVFDLDTDVNSASDINNLFPDYEQYIYFGAQLPDGLDIAEIRTVGKPYSYSLSVQGFPIGLYKDEYCTFDISDTNSGPFSPSSAQYNLNPNTDFSFEYDEDGNAYILFFRPAIDLTSYTDSQNKIMIDYWVNHEFIYGYDYYIHEDREDNYISQIEWVYSYMDVVDINTDTFRLHPDFTDDTSFNVEYYALEWKEFDENYIKDGEDIFTFQPIEYYNISVLYTGYTTSETFSAQYIVPEGQYKEDHIVFPSIYVLAQLTGDDESIRVFELTNDILQNFITQEAPSSYNYIIDFDEIETYLQNTYDPNYELVKDSYIYVLAEYDSILLRYQMGHTPFNYQYLEGLGGDHDAYHIALYIDDVITAYSYQSNFDDYVSKIENGLIYFNDKADGEAGYIAPHSTIKLTYKFKLQPGLIDRKHFMIITYPWMNSFDTILDSLNPVDSAQSTYREQYRKLSGGSIITPFEYSLSIENKYSLYLTYRLNQKDYYEEKFEIKYENFDSEKRGYVYKFMSQQLDNYIDVLEYDGENSINIYYFNALNQMTFLDPSHFEVDLGSRE
ncbi:hypothetical protein LCGC14_1176010, partial [marine sediment metagenome]